jgi:hypothetical protein
MIEWNEGSNLCLHFQGNQLDSHEFTILFSSLGIIRSKIVEPKTSSILSLNNFYSIGFSMFLD